MCGRYVATKDVDGLLKMFVVDERDPRAKAGTPSSDVHVTWTGEANYNVAPTDQVPAIVRHEDDLALTKFRWGLVPFWAKDLKVGARMINARSESITTKSAFAESFERRRCLLPADGFYEWQKADRARLPWFVARSDGEPMVFAGIWSSWRDRGEPQAERVLTCSILTTTANDVIRPIHDRMPVVLDRADWDTWLDPQADPETLTQLLTPADDDAISRYRVSTRVNSVANNDPTLVDPLPAQQPDLVGPGHPSTMVEGAQQSLF
ncbi:MAG: SOS response-associated peptidase [Euzebya sp.]